MNIITISREFGSGGRELGKRMADVLGYDYYDKEIISEIASRHNLNENYVEQALISSPVPTPTLSFRHSFSSPMYIHAPRTDLLVEQRKIIEEIAAKGKNFIIIGRNADVLLREFNPFNIFVTADMQTKIKRCLERAEDGENLTEKEMKKKILKIDKARARARYLITEREWGCKDTYNLIINSSDWCIKSLANVIAEVARQYFE